MARNSLDGSFDIFLKVLKILNEKIQKFGNCDVFFLHPPSFFRLFGKHTNWHKIITRGRIDILRPDFESSWCILSRYEFVDAKFCVFHAFLQPKRYITLEPLKLPVQTLDTVWVTKRYQNMKIKLEMESMDPKLSKSGLRMFLRCLVRNLCSEIAGWVLAKNRKNSNFC